MITRKLVVVPPVSGGGGASGRYLQRTLLLKNTMIGDDIADHVTVNGDGVGYRVVGVLRKTITDDLTVRINKDGSELMTITIPNGTGIDTPIESTDFTSDPQPFIDGEVLSWDVIESDEQIDRNGVASFTVEWIES